MIYPIEYHETCKGEYIKIRVSTPEKTITTTYPQAYSDTYRRWTQDEIFEKIYLEEAQNKK